MRILLCFFFCALPVLPCFGATYYYVGSPGDWDTAANWSAASGGAGGAGIPGTGDSAIFDVNSGNCTVDAAVTVSNLSLAATFASILDMDSSVLTIEYASGGGLIQIDAGEIQLGSGIHKIYGDWSYTAGTITPETSSVIFYARRSSLAASPANTTQVDGAFTLNNVRLSSESWMTGTLRLNITGDPLVVNGTLTLDGGTGSWGYYMGGGGHIHAKGTVTRHTSRTLSILRGNVKLTINGSTDQLQDSLWWQVGDYTVDKPSGTLTCTNKQTFVARTDSSLSYFTFDSPCDFTSHVTTVEFYFQYAALPVITGSTDLIFYDLILNGPSGTGNAYLDLGGKTVTVSNDCTITLNPDWNRRLNNGTVDVKGDLTLNTGSGSWVNGTALLKMSGTGDATLDGATRLGNDLRIEKTGATVTLVDDYGGTDTGEDVILASGTLDLAGYNLIAGGTFDVDGSLRLKGNETITVGTLALDTTTSTVQFYDSAVAAYLANLGATGFFNLTLGADKNHYFVAGNTYQVDGALDSDGTQALRSVLRSTVDETPWNLNVQGTAPLANAVNVKDCDASSGNEVVAHGSVDIQNNVNWDFGANPGLAIDNASGASDIGTTTATLNGHLYTTSGATYVTVFIGESDPGKIMAGWWKTNALGQQATGDVAYVQSGLLADTTYYYRFYASNSIETVFADPVSSFTTEIDQPSYANKMKITFDYDRDETLTNFPALVVFNESISSFHYSQFESTNGYDLRFLNYNESAALNYEIEDWDTTGDSCVWVQVDRLSSSQNYIWALWGNPAATNAPKPYTTNGATWSEGYLAVYHLNEANPSGDFGDSTANDFDGADAGVTDTAGVIAGGQNFSGADVDINITGIESTRSDPDRNYTFSLWINATSTDTDVRMIDILTGRMLLGMNIGGFQYHDGTWRGPYGSGYNDGNWHHVTFLFNDVSNQGSIYGDGGEIQTGITYAPKNLGGSSRIGTDQDGAGYDYDGLMDEVRISTVVRSTNWIWATYMTAGSNDVFTAYDVSAMATIFRIR